MVFFTEVCQKFGTFESLKINKNLKEQHKNVRFHLQKIVI